MDVKMNRFLTFLLAAVCIVCCGTEQFNDGFERCKADKRGIPQPVGWNLDRLSKNATVRLARESGCARNGIFGLLAETDVGGQIYFRTLPSFKVAPGENIEMKIYARGSGRYRLLYYVFGTDDPQKTAFIQTIGFGKPKTAKETEWELYSSKGKFFVPSKAKGKFTQFALRPVIFVYGDSEITFDDFSLKISQ